MGDRLLIDPYNDKPEFSLGLKLPKDLQADLFLVSHPDEDHSLLKSKWVRKSREAYFPNLHLKGTLVHEWAGDLNIAYSFTIDGFRFVHLADNARDLTDLQIEEIGKVDILFSSPPKMPGSSYFINNIKALNPKIVIPSHYIPLNLKDGELNENEIMESLSKIILQKWIKNPHADEKTVKVMANIFIGARKLKETFSDYREIYSESIEIFPKETFNNPTIFLFRKCWQN